MTTRLRIFVAPKMRGDCASLPRPCPLVFCKHNLRKREESNRGHGGKGVSRSMSSDDEARIVMLHGEGRSQCEIGRIVGKDQGTVKAVLMRTGAIDSPVGRFSCALDAAEQGGMTLDEVGVEFGITRERVRQIQNSALSKLRKLYGDDFSDYLADRPGEWTDYGEDEEDEDDE